MDRKPRFRAKPSDWSLTEEYKAFAAGPGKAMEFLTPEASDDYALMMLGTSVIDSYLKFGLVVRLRGLEAEGENGKRMMTEIFEGHGPLSTFSSKISLYSGMGLFLDDERHDLDIIRGVRNKFAHSPSRLHFKDFTHLKTLKVASNRKISDRVPERLAFKQSCAGIVLRLSISAAQSPAEWAVLAKHSNEISSFTDQLVRAGRAGGEDLAKVYEQFRSDHPPEKY